MIAEYERAQIVERSRRGKRHRAKAGCVNVLSGAPYGYRYVKKTDVAEAYYAVIESEAEVVREAFELYAKELWSIGAIARHLNQRGVRTRFGRGPWERSTIWGMLRNPAYQGTACFGKTERVPRRKITRPKISEFPMRRGELPMGSGKFLKNGLILVGSGRALVIEAQIRVRLV